MYMIMFYFENVEIKTNKQTNVSSYPIILQTVCLL